MFKIFQKSREHKITELRNKNSDNLLSIGLKTADALPFSLVQSLQRDQLDVFNRALALSFLGAKSEVISDTSFIGSIHQLKLTHIFSTDEIRFLEASESDLATISQFNWGYEAASALIWTIDSQWHMGDMNSIVDAGRVSRYTLQTLKSGRQFVYRDEFSILKMKDWYHRLLWNYRQDRIDKIDKEYPFDPAIIRQRLKALSWVLNQNFDWDHPYHTST